MPVPMPNQAADFWAKKKKPEGREIRGSNYKLDQNILYEETSTENVEKGPEQDGVEQRSRSVAVTSREENSSSAPEHEEQMQVDTWRANHSRDDAFEEQSAFNLVANDEQTQVVTEGASGGSEAHIPEKEHSDSAADETQVVADEDTVMMNGEPVPYQDVLKQAFAAWKAAGKPRCEECKSEGLPGKHPPPCDPLARAENAQRREEKRVAHERRQMKGPVTKEYGGQRGQAKKPAKLPCAKCFIFGHNETECRARHCNRCGKWHMGNACPSSPTESVQADQRPNIDHSRAVHNLLRMSRQAETDAEVDVLSCALRSELATQIQGPHLIQPHRRSRSPDRRDEEKRDYRSREEKRRDERRDR